MGWIECNLRGTTVFARAKGEGGGFEVGADGRVDVKYKLDDAAKVYRASARNLEPVAGAKPVEPAPQRAGTVIIYTDGACTGNPGPMGVGVVILRSGEPRQEIGEYLGTGTNNIAELTAIERAVDALRPEDKDVERGADIVIHTDSSYAIGVCSMGWKAKANTELVARIRQKLAALPRVRFVKVAGHAGIPENERCDELARQAVEGRTRR